MKTHRKVLRQLKIQLKYLRQFIKFYLARCGIYPKINLNLQLIDSTDLPDCLKCTLKQMAISGYPGTINFIKSYLFNAIKLIKIREQIEVEGPILVCAVKNDLVRIKMQVEHHRNIGVKEFIYIDNMSTDGTFEWLSKQNDVTLYKVETPYDSSTRSGWIQLALKQEGYSKWYLILDSDELFAYPNMEITSIQKYISFLEKKQITTTTTPLIDMYSKSKMFDADPHEDIKTAYCFFDIFYLKGRYYTNWFFSGGPRLRLFSMEGGLIKHSLLKVEENTVFRAHSVFPFKRNFEAGVNAFLLHYKFLPDDRQKYQDIIEKGNYANGSKEYKAYIEVYKRNPDISFYYSGSQKLNNSMDLLKINITDKTFFKEFLEWLQ